MWRKGGYPDLVRAAVCPPAAGETHTFHGRSESAMKRTREESSPSKAGKVEEVPSVGAGGEKSTHEGSTADAKR